MLGGFLLAVSLMVFDTLPPPVQQGASAVITGTLSAAPGDLVVLDASGSRGEAKKWILPESLESKSLPFGDKLVFSTGTPGRYRVGIAVGASGEPVTLDVRFVEVVVGDIKPAPNPTPGPTPDPLPPKPDPVVDMKGHFVVLIEETEDRYKYPYLINIISAKGYWDGLEKRGLLFMPYDRDNKDVAAYRADAEAVGLPAILIVSPKGVVLKAKQCPPTTTGIDDMLKESFK